MTKEEIHWIVTANAAPDLDKHRSSLRVDVLVIGGGLTGCRTALGLADRGVSVAVVDAQDVGWGASGRSGGQCNPIWRKTPDDLRDLLGARHGDNLVRTTLTAADDLFSDIRTFDVDCDAVQAGWVQAAHTRKAIQSMGTLGRAWKKAGADIEEIDGDAVEYASGSPAYRWALKHAAGGHVQPLSLTRGYAKAAIARGAQFYNKTPVTKLDRKNGKWHATTPEGEITAENVVLTTNAYTSGLWPGLSKTFHPLVSVSIATAPLSAMQQQTVLPGSVTISDSRLAIYYARYDREKRLIFGCVGSTDHVDPLALGRLRGGLRTVFPQIADIAIERKWAGRIAVTPEMMPHMHEPAPGILAGIGFSGRGIAMTSVMGRALSGKLLGTPPDDLPFPVVPVSPVPLHDITRRLIPFAAPAMTLKDKLDALTNGA
ncbi:FAD-binding oxidoreductase [Sulfitobacter sp. S190]|uniref:NAD(P)/FAD-dependent oxidoreductase n=1 Tax=Sulfitobacter sp. S190 TaxID=2867022 RepID=UPI0021A72025|nr:FAD-binding oxidoreductase [Sulfitobacter sp. S190]UWR23017.1 FAD-binding oxidoreductase [Sulfitobacter sp. S190]